MMGIENSFSLVLVFVWALVFVLIVLAGFGGIVSSSEDQFEIEIKQTTSVVVQGEPADADVLITNNGDTEKEVNIAFWVVGEIGENQEGVEFSSDDVTLTMIKDGDSVVMPHEFEKTFTVDQNSTEEFGFKIYYHGAPTSEQVKVWLVGDLSSKVVDESVENDVGSGGSSGSTPSDSDEVDEEIDLGLVDRDLSMFNEAWNFSSVLINDIPTLNLVFEEENTVKFVLAESGLDDDNDSRAVVVVGSVIGEPLYVETGADEEGNQVATLDITAETIGENIASVFVGDPADDLETIINGDVAGQLNSLEAVEKNLELSVISDELVVGEEIGFNVTIDGEPVEGATISYDYLNSTYESITNSSGVAFLVFDEPGDYLVISDMGSEVVDSQLFIYNMDSVEVEISEERGMFSWLVVFAGLIGTLILFLAFARRKKPMEE